MNRIEIFFSALTAFVISAGGSVVVIVGSGNALNKTAWTLSVIVGLITAAKDTRSLLKLPPVSPTDTEPTIPQPTKPAGQNDIKDSSQIKP